jgi:hypothetical protein
MGEEAEGAIRVLSKLRIFLSLDVVGSTEYKQPRADRLPDDKDHWVRPFLGFYRMSVDEMRSQWEQVKAELRAAEERDSGHFELSDCPEFWKGAGDEVLFSKVVASPYDVVASIQTLIRVMEAHRVQFASKPQTKGLNVKGTAWLAGFPLNNAEIVIAVDGSSASGRSDDHLADNYRLLSRLDADATLREKFRADYIGPSIDLGFRLREHATSRRLVVSPDLIWLLCRAEYRATNDERDACRMLELPKIGYAGSKPLRGIMGGDSYPIFWIEAEAGSALDNAEDKLLSRVHHTGGDYILAYCREFLDGTSPLRMTPYIPGCRDPAVGTISEDRAGKVQRLEKYVNGMLGSLESFEIDDASEKDKATIPPEATAFADEQAKKTNSPG